MNALKHLKIGTRLALGFLVVIVAGLMIAAFGWTQLGGLNRMVRELAEDRMLKVDQFGRIKDNANVVARGVRNIVLLEEAAEIAKEKSRIDEMRADSSQLMQALEKTLSGDDERSALAALVAAGLPYSASLDKVIALAVENRDAEARDMLLKETRPAQNAYFKVLDQLKQLEQTRMRDTATLVGDTARSAGTMMLAVAGIATVCGLSLAWVLTRSITQPIRQAVRVAQTVADGDLSIEINPIGRDETAELLTALRVMTRSLVSLVGAVRQSSDSIATGSGEIATGNADLSQRTEEQASNLQQTAASMEELASTVRTNAETARQANELAATASAAALEGGNVVSRVVKTMGEISGSSRRIEDIIGVIDGIAFQTNILALNAAVEAARAGEQGRGFAVVASEVRGLAQRSAQAAKEIKALIGASVEQVSAGSALVGDAGQAIDRIVDQVQLVAQLINQISNASDEQTTGINQVNFAVTQLDTVTQQNAALVEQSAAAAESLSQQAGRLIQAISVFRLGHAAA